MSKIVLIRHGQSVSNRDNIYAGWLNSPLTEKGQSEAILVGKSLKQYNINFDIAYTSMLDRSIDTLQLILKELNISNIKFIKSWMLNERHYGTLEGMDKDEAMKEFGLKKMNGWLKGIREFPPKMLLDNPMHPLNNKIYKIIDPNLLPSSENLESVNIRVTEYFEANIIGNIMNNKNIIIVSHQNPLRSLISYIEDLTTDEMLKLDLSNAEAIIYEIDSELNVLSKECLNIDTSKL